MPSTGLRFRGQCLLDLRVRGRGWHIGCSRNACRIYFVVSFPMYLRFTSRRSPAQGSGSGALSPRRCCPQHAKTLCNFSVGREAENCPGPRQGRRRSRSRSLRPSSRASQRAWQCSACSTLCASRWGRSFTWRSNDLARSVALRPMAVLCGVPCSCCSQRLTCEVVQVDGTLTCPPFRGQLC